MINNQEILKIIKQYENLTNSKCLIEKSTNKTIHFIKNNKEFRKTTEQIKEFINFKLNNITTPQNQKIQTIIKTIINKKPINKPKLINISFWLEQEQTNKFKKFIKSNNTTINKFLQELIKEILNNYEIK